MKARLGVAAVSDLKAKAWRASIEGKDATLVVSAELLVQLIDRIEELQSELEDRTRSYHGHY